MLGQFTDITATQMGWPILSRHEISPGQDQIGMRFIYRTNNIFEIEVAVVQYCVLCKLQGVWYSDKDRSCLNMRPEQDNVVKKEMNSLI